MTDSTHRPGPRLIDRRRALLLFGTVGLGAVATACGGGSSTDSSGSRATGSSTSDRAADCTLSPESTEGPFYLDGDLVRSDITDGRPGAPLTLELFVVDADGCAPIRDAAVDIWHTDAGGLYSGFQQASRGGSGGGSGPTDADRFMRGTQVSDATGRVEFATVYPGWYPGRTVHIHVKVHVGGNEVHTGQLYFDDDVTDTVYRDDPYAARGDRDTRNSDDGIYGSGGKASTLLVAGGGEGYRATLVLGVATG